MITRRTKVQLVIFLVITLVGVTFVGARYADLTRFFFPETYDVTAHFPDSGGIFDGAVVTYRGVNIGKVGQLQLTDAGVDVHLRIKKKFDHIPADTLALVGNGSAVGEQYVELQPKTDKGPYLKNKSEIAQKNTSIPIATDTLLTHLSDTVGSVNQQDLQTTVRELGKAFDGTGEDLQKIIDTGNDFIRAANDNFDVTTALIKDSNTVLKTQIGKEGDIRTFSRELKLFSTTLVASDPDIRRLIRTGSLAAVQLRQFIIANRIDFGQLISRLVTTGRIVVKHLPGLREALVIYPYIVEGGFTVVSKSPETGLYDAHFGAILTTTPVCHQGYGGTKTRSPQELADEKMNLDAKCAEAASKSNPRGAQNAPGADKLAINRNRPPVVASYDPTTGKLVWGSTGGSLAATAPAPASLGADAWKWFYLQPMTR